MPKIAVYKYLTFFIYSYDALYEPPHVHVVKEKGSRQRSAKIWLNTLVVAEKGSLSDSDINLAIRIIKEHKEAFINSFNQVKEGQKITTIRVK